MRPPSSSIFVPPPFHVLLSLVTCGILLLSGEAGAQTPCPEECSCFGTFVSCYQFTERSLNNLPGSANTLVLNSGRINSFPPGFATKFPLLTLLDIQSTKVETIVNGTFSGLKGLHQLAVSDCQVGSIETGAFRNISAISQVLISESAIGTIQSGAFSQLSNIGEFRLWSTQIERVEKRAFTELSNLDSFAFYMNNVSALSQDAFAEIQNLGKVDVYMNKFSNARGSAVKPLQAATNDMNMYSNTFPCSCAVLRDFNATLLKPYMVSQKCVRDGRVFRLTDLNEAETCRGQPFTTSTSTSTTTTTTTPNSATTSTRPTSNSTTAVTHTTVNNVTTTAPKRRTDPPTTTTTTTTKQSPVSTKSSMATKPTGVTGQRSTSAAGVTQSGKGDNSEQTGDSSSGVGVGVGVRCWVVTLATVVPLVTIVTAV